MENNHKFFVNRECKYLPCHDGSSEDNFNCLFCYCPLYTLGENCGGNFKFSGEKKIKDCADCRLPHIPEYYDVVMDKLIAENKKKNL